MMFNSRLIVSLVVITVLGASNINALPLEGDNVVLARRGAGHASGHASGHGTTGGFASGAGRRVVVRLKRITKSAYKKGKAEMDRAIEEANRTGAWKEEAEDNIRDYVEDRLTDGIVKYFERTTRIVSADMPRSQPGCTSDGSDTVQVEFNEGSEEENAAMLNTVAAKFATVVQLGDLCPELAKAKTHAPTSQLTKDGKLKLHLDGSEPDEAAFYPNDPAQKIPKAKNFGEKFVDPGLRAKFTNVVDSPTKA
ncbi:hypothetical protein HGRIS_005566 [Hohenbuehelia grisea]|uniref:Uncharacterized protein n=1 Tax=Hohenbuehelia grisea TaxID=104357 RepID=A0ABR3JX91_9AGAR